MSSSAKENFDQTIKKLEWQVQHEKDLGQNMNVLLENKLSEQIAYGREQEQKQFELDDLISFKNKQLEKQEKEISKLETSRKDLESRIQDL